MTKGAGRGRRERKSDDIVRKEQEDENEHL